ncbi:hypothetical protein DFH07DRAFT_874432 [Mycena maculata]|uniref:DUF7918 domain-containing protein n=1 Tax=Mycena maculata TaxID=230809 RepID=A0AAD7P059_9AGAR|nr:hypothetical protein DFH07DRAFT_874432 [Mycena maculata]
MPLKANGFQAWIKVDDHEAQHFQPEKIDDPSGQTCWIVSELNKGFSVHWRNTDVFCQTAGRLWVDGVECSGEILMGPNLETSVSGRRTSGSTITPVIFSSLELTDDDAFLDSAAPKDIGLIRLEIWTINRTGSVPFSNIAPREASKIHERSKKLGAHQTKFGDQVVEPITRYAAVFDYLEALPMVTFTFKYRPLELLKANGITPSSVLGKNNAEGGPSRSVKQETKGAKRGVSQPASFSSGEIIDLTRSESPVTPEIIDLT